MPPGPSGHGLLTLIFHRMRQRPFMIEDCTENAHVEITAAVLFVF
jgi:hypothetical protein